MSTPFYASFDAFLDTDLTHQNVLPRMREYQARCRIVRDQYRSGEITIEEYYLMETQMIQDVHEVQVRGAPAYHRSVLRARINTNNQRDKKDYTRHRLLRKLEEKRQAEATKTTTQDSDE